MIDELPDPWTIYWQADRMDSCISGQAEADEQQLQALWAGVLEGQSQPCRIIDLATGNGAVALRLARTPQAADGKVFITAVDLADIDPAKFLTNDRELVSRINFMGNSDICELRFEDNAFDIAVSQFGFEYAPRDQAVAELFRLLSPGGSFRFLMHHSDGALVAPNVAQVREIDNLCKPRGVVEELGQYLGTDGGGSVAVLEKAGVAHAELQGGRLPRISQEIFRAVNQLVSRRDIDAGTRMNAFSGMRKRLLAERLRMVQLANAALDTDSIEQLMQLMRRAGFGQLAHREYRIGDDRALLGWLVTGQK